MVDTTAASTGRAIYHAVWELVGETFFDKARLANWSSWEHRFDEQIDGEERALGFVDEMLASLGDTYTERVVPPVMTAAPSADASPPVPPPQPDDVLAVLTPSNIGYLRISSFDRDDVLDRIKAGVEKISAAEGVILDLRGNSGGSMHQMFEACGFFVENGVLGTVKFRHGDGTRSMTYMVNVGQFFACEELPDGTTTNFMYLRQQPLLAGKPLVILINRRTASAGEMMTCALVQNGFDGAISIIGTGPTPGKGIGQAEYSLFEGKVVVRVTRCHWFAPGGEWLGDCGQTASDGISPWVVVEGDRGPEALGVASDELKKMLGREDAA